MDERTKTSSRIPLADWLQAKAHEAERMMKHNPLSESYYEGQMHAYNEVWRRLQEDENAS